MTANPLKRNERASIFFQISHLAAGGYRAGRQASQVSFFRHFYFFAFGWAVAAIIASFSHGMYRDWGIVYAILFALISWGLYKMRREAAIGGFLFCLIGLSFNAALDWATFQTLIMLAFYVQAIRGTFAYVRLSQSQ